MGLSTDNKNLQGVQQHIIIQAFHYSILQHSLNAHALIKIWMGNTQDQIGILAGSEFGPVVNSPQ